MDKTGRGILIQNGPVSSKMWVDKNNRIDYKEIYLHCQNLYIPDLPGDKDLERIE